ncbi:MAG TPA: hypothetical protein PL097_06850 [Dysgonamonadaceae bacterium]|nr:hypothetical protein [Dysgonamonadaceae bacterium]HRU13388.1 hypothetical protein [Dysgonamonadaceae bacterium]
MYKRISITAKSENPTSRLCAFVANKSTAFQAGFCRRFTPQNKFCGYENSAFQAKNTFAVEAFNSSANLCLKDNNFHNHKSPTCGRRRPCNPCLKGRTIAAASRNIYSGEKEQTE